MDKTEKRRILKFLTFLIIFVFISSLRVNAIESEVSKIRLRRIAAIIREFTDAKEKISDPFVQEAIMEKVGRMMPLEPDVKPNVKNISQIATEVRAVVSKKFPDSINTIRAKAEKEAERKYKLKKKLDFVTVTVIRGGHSFQVSGIFYRYGLGGNSVVIGDNSPIAFIDLAPEDRAKFDKDYCVKVRKDYVREKIRNYYKRRQSYLNLLFSDKLEKMARENEKLGYIYVWNKWRTPKEVTEFMIKQSMRQQEKEALKNSDRTDDSGDDSGVADTDTRPPSAPVDITGGGSSENTPSGKVEAPTDNKSLRIARLKQEIEKRQMEIVGSQYGVDAEQFFSKGDLLVLLGMPQEDVNLLTGLKGTGDTESIVYKKGPYEKVVFYFINKILYKIEVVYRIGLPEAMKIVIDDIHDRFGESAEAKEMRIAEKERQKRLKAVKHMCKKHSWNSKGVCTKCGVRKADLNPPPVSRHIVETWKGDVVTAVLTAELAEDESNFTSIVLSKEVPAIKLAQEKILEQERIRKAEEEKRKSIEEYKKEFK